MPFKSQAQMRWMYANHPKMAARWAAHTSDKKELPDKKEGIDGSLPSWNQSAADVEDQNKIPNEQDAYAQQKRQEFGQEYPLPRMVEVFGVKRK